MTLSRLSEGSAYYDNKISSRKSTKTSIMFGLIVASISETNKWLATCFKNYDRKRFKVIKVMNSCSFWLLK